MAREREIAKSNISASSDKPFGIILAGGLSSRMGGGDKSLLALDGTTLLEHVCARLEPQVSGMALNANGDPVRFAGFGLGVIADTLPDFPGPLAGVLAGMEYAASCGATEIVTVAADTPFYPADLVSRLQAAQAAEGTPLAMAMTPDPERGLARHPTFGLWPVALAGDLRAALLEGTRKIVAWTSKHGCAKTRFEVEPYDPFFNVNTPEDMEQARRMIAEFGL